MNIPPTKTLNELHKLHEVNTVKITSISELIRNLNDNMIAKIVGDINITDVTNYYDSTYSYVYVKVVGCEMKLARKWISLSYDSKRNITVTVLKDNIIEKIGEYY